MEGRPIKIAIEGNIAAGKSSFLDLVNKHTNFKTQQVAISNLQLNPHPPNTATVHHVSVGVTLLI